MANIITFSRIIFSIVLIFLRYQTKEFVIIYLLAGLSDMLDGFVARISSTISDFGSKLDSFADAIFIIVVLIKILPKMKFNKIVILLIGIIFLIKMINLTINLVKTKEMINDHNILNKITGLLLFVFPIVVKENNKDVLSNVMITAALFASLLEFKNQLKQ